MNTKSSITPNRFLNIFPMELWRNLRNEGFGVTPINSYSAFITVEEAILCTMDILGHIDPDPTFREGWASEFNVRQDRMILIYLTTLHDCLHRLTLSRLGVSVSEDTLDLLAEVIEEYSPEDEDATDESYEDEPLSAEEVAEDSTGTDESPGLHFLPPEDEVLELENCPDITFNIFHRKPTLCWGQITAGLAAGIALGAAFFRRRK